MRIVSGIQPTGSGLHLGNYLGALKRFVGYQSDATECLFCVVDLHAMTVRHDPAELRRAVQGTLATFLAAGLDPARSILFAQSRVREHAELAWILNCTARMGQLERMTQFKEKAGADAERQSLGLFAYPVLMAADILLYRADQVPVGSDQIQHLELARDIARTFNRDHRHEVFRLPRPMISGAAARVMNLQDPERKMSKSDPSELGRIGLLDGADAIARKIAKAVTDGGAMPTTTDELDARPGPRNLVHISAALAGRSIAETLADLDGLRFSDLKRRVTDQIVAEIVPVGERIRELVDDTDALDAILEDGAAKARRIADTTMSAVREVCGYR
jgi:tryptophanyl-tRNA synthetase